MIDFYAAPENEKIITGAAVKKRTGIIKDPRYAAHCMGPEEPECPERLDVLHALLQEPELTGCFQDISPRKAEREELQRVHSLDYIQRLEATSGQENTYLDEDTRTSPLSHEVALLAAGGLCRAIEQVHAGRVDNAFALIRPPRTPCRTGGSQGILPLQQCGHRRALRPEQAGAGAHPDRRLGPSSRQWDPTLFRKRSVGAVLLHPSGVYLSPQWTPAGDR